eukprot:4337-Heterococcus_DN1.PRE.1
MFSLREMPGGRERSSLLLILLLLSAVLLLVVVVLVVVLTWSHASSSTYAQPMLSLLVPAYGIITKAADRAV